MLQRQSGQYQLRLLWNPEDGVWSGMPAAPRSDCQTLLAQLLQSVATAERTERRKNDERQDFQPAS
jgi:hypothetical protein